MRVRSEYLSTYMCAEEEEKDLLNTCLQNEKERERKKERKREREQKKDREKERKERERERKKKRGGKELIIHTQSHLRFQRC